MSNLKAAAFDLDDTLLRDDLTISSYTVDVFRRLSAAGFRLIAASGRTVMSMQPFVERLGCVSLCVACNGALVYHPVSREVLHREQLSVELCHEIARFGNAHHCYAQTYSDDRFFFNEYSEYSRRYAAASMLPGEYVGDLEAYIREPRTKILMMAEPEKIADMLAEARSVFAGRASVTCSKAWFLEFNPLRATKGIALQKCADFLGMNLSDFAAFGDSLNDLPMLQAAGRGIAVANARPEVRAACADVCPSNEEDGVARYLASNVLCEEAVL